MVALGVLIACIYAPGVNSRVVGGNTQNTETTKRVHAQITALMGCHLFCAPSRSGPWGVGPARMCVFVFLLSQHNTQLFA